MNSTIADIRVHPISVPLARPFWMSLEPYTAAAEIVAPRLIGAQALDHERIWDGLFRSTFSRDWATVAAADGQPQ